MRVQIADDHAMLREGLRTALMALPGVELAPDICGGQGFLEQVQQGRADVLICDVQMPGFEIVSTLVTLQAQKIKTRVLVFSGEATRKLVQAVAQAGAAGYILKGELMTGAALAEILRTLVAGGTWFSPATQGYLLPNAQRDGLTPRECQVVVVMQAGKEPTEVADALGISTQRVYNIQSALRQKFGVTTNAALLAKFQQDDMLRQ
jgi:DNA-binding NarL/FixJ family response regulator